MVTSTAERDTTHLGRKQVYTTLMLRNLCTDLLPQSFRNLIFEPLLHFVHHQEFFRNLPSRCPALKKKTSKRQ
jgi:hypothetical protein